MNQKRTRFDCHWDCSNQGKIYTNREKQFIERSVRQGKSITHIAKCLRRGWWAIEVQVKGYGKDSNGGVHSVGSNGLSTSKKVHQQKSQILPAFRRKQFDERKIYGSQSGVKHCSQRNRVFEGKQGVLKTEKTEMERELKELLGL